MTNNPITDNGLRHLSPLTKLERLFLPHLPITDVGLSYLRQSTGMQVLSLQGTKVTMQGATRLRQAFPKATIDMPDAADP